MIERLTSSPVWQMRAPTYGPMAMVYSKNFSTITFRPFKISTTKMENSFVKTDDLPTLNTNFDFQQLLVQIFLQFLGSFVHLATNLRWIKKRRSTVQRLFLFSFAFIKLPNLFVFHYDGCVSLSFLFGLFNVSPPHFLDLVKKKVLDYVREERRKQVRMMVHLWCISTTNACGFENSINCSP